MAIPLLVAYVSYRCRFQLHQINFIQILLTTNIFNCQQSKIFLSQFLHLRVKTFIMQKIQLNQNPPFRILIVGTNKSLKQKLINSLCESPIYSYDPIRRQQCIYIFRRRQSPEDRIYHPKHNLDNQKQITFSSQQSITKFIGPYLKNYHAQIDPSLQQIHEFVIECNLQLNCNDRPIEVIDLPHLFDLENQHLMEYGPGFIGFDLIVIVMHSTQAIKENQKNIRKAIFGNAINSKYFFNTVKVWVTSSKVERIDNELFNELDNIVELQNFKKYIQVRIEQLVEINNIKSQVNHKEQIAQNILQVKQEIQDRMPEQIQMEQLLPEQPSPILLMSEKQISELSTKYIKQFLNLLEQDTQKMNLQQYNQFLSVIGYNKTIAIRPLSYLREIFLAMLIILIILFTQNEYLLILLVLIAISAVSRTLGHNKESLAEIAQQKQRHRRVLYGSIGDGLIPQKIQQLRRRMELM